MNHLRSSTISEQGFNFTAVVACDRSGIFAAISGETTRDLLSFLIFDQNSIAALKRAGYGCNTCRKEASSFFECFGCAIVDDDAA